MSTLTYCDLVRLQAVLCSHTSKLEEQAAEAKKRGNPDRAADLYRSAHSYIDLKDKVARAGVDTLTRQLRGAHL